MGEGDAAVQLQAGQPSLVTRARIGHSKKVGAELAAGTYEPIQISVTSLADGPDGVLRFVVNDQHHRLAAAMEHGAPVLLVPTIGAPQNARNFSAMSEINVNPSGGRFKRADKDPGAALTTDEAREGL